MTLQALQQALRDRLLSIEIDPVAPDDTRRQGWTVMLTSQEDIDETLTYEIPGDNLEFLFDQVLTAWDQGARDDED